MNLVKSLRENDIIKYDIVLGKILDTPSYKRGIVVVRYEKECNSWKLDRFHVIIKDYKHAMIYGSDDAIKISETVHYIIPEKTETLRIYHHAVTPSSLSFLEKFERGDYKTIYQRVMEVYDNPKLDRIQCRKQVDEIIGEGAYDKVSEMISALREHEMRGMMLTYGKDFGDCFDARDNAYEFFHTSLGTVLEQYGHGNRR
jgi:hypothetical protein